MTRSQGVLQLKRRESVSDLFSKENEIALRFCELEKMTSVCDQSRESILLTDAKLNLAWLTFTWRWFPSLFPSDSFSSWCWRMPKPHSLLPSSVFWSLFLSGVYCKLSFCMFRERASWKVKKVWRKREWMRIREWLKRRLIGKLSQRAVFFSTRQ